jgi:hypothetical protein
VILLLSLSVARRLALPPECALLSVVAAVGSRSRFAESAIVSDLGFYYLGQSYEENSVCTA